MIREIKWGILGTFCLGGLKGYRVGKYTVLETNLDISQKQKQRFIMMIQLITRF